MKQRNCAEQKNQEEYTEDPLTEVLRQGARALLPRRWRKKSRPFWPHMPTFMMLRGAHNCGEWALPRTHHSSRHWGRPGPRP